MKICAGSFFLLFVFAFGCSKDNHDHKNVSQGVYEGYYARSCGPTENCIAVNQMPRTISVTFSPETFNASRLHSMSALACTGSYKVNGDSIRFTNTCSLNSPVDSTLVFAGAYQIVYNSGDSLVFRRSKDLSNPEYPIEAFYFNKTAAN